MHILIAGGTGTAGRVLARHGAENGHSVRVLSRTSSTSETHDVEVVTGDLQTGEGLGVAMQGIDTVIDVSNIITTSYRKAARFFVAGTTNLLAAEQAAGVRHHLVLSIVGIDSFPLGYYRAKLDQEQAVVTESARRGVPYSITRVTQFHDFVALTYRTLRLGRLVLVPPMHLQPVHLNDVAQHVLAIVEGGASQRGPELSGPQPEELLDLVRRYAATRPERVRVVPLPLPPAARRANESRVLQPVGGQRGSLTFDDWLADQLTL